MAYNKGNAVWSGTLKEGKGNVSTQSGALDSAYSFGTRFADDSNGTNPEELIGAAHAGCFSMFLAGVLEQAGTPAKHIKTESKVTLGKDERGPFISKIELTTEAEVPGIKNEEFQTHAKKAKEDCPISRSLGAVKEINLHAVLK